MKRIGVFTKMEMVGGSEFRAVELANALARADGVQAVLLVEKEIPSRLRQAIEPSVETHSGVFSQPEIAPFYSLDRLVVINSDSRFFTTDAYWLGQTEAHSHPVELSRIPGMAFLFNFIVSPACQLPALQRLVPDIRIITANSRFFDEIGKQGRYESVRHYPRLRLESPIDPAVGRPKTASIRRRFGMHSLPIKSKWNADFPELIGRINHRFPNEVAWDFMGMPESLQRTMPAGNVTTRSAFAVETAEFLRGVDVFLFFGDWKREEAWARSVGEAVMSGCPVIATNRGGNLDQVIHGNTGFLCGSLAETEEACARLIRDGDLFAAMQRNARIQARNFASATVARRLLDFLE